MRKGASESDAGRSAFDKIGRQGRRENPHKAGILHCSGNDNDKLRCGEGRECPAVRRGGQSIFASTKVPLTAPNPKVSVALTIESRLWFTPGRRGVYCLDT